MADSHITYFAATDSRNKRVPFGIKEDDRSRHMYIIGKTGMGKSTLLENLAVQDIQQGEGMAFIDPHGKTADLLLDYIPQHRIKDVVYFAPFDLDYPIAFNVMEDVGHDRRHLVANGLMSAFKKIWVDAWSARMEYILNNILLALLEYPDATLVGVNRMLADKDYRKKVVENITDPSVKAFWLDEFAKYGERYMQEAGAAIQNKIGQFVANPLVRNIIGQPKSTFDMRKIMDEKKILIINLSKGRVGEANANLLGSMLITKIYLGAMSRADVGSAVKKLPPFNLYVDEFQNFANESFADILSEARKYKLALTVAHQYIEQMSDEVRAAVFGNVGTMVAFRVGAFDAEVLEKEFFPTFTKEDIVNLGIFQVYMKLMIDGVTSPPFSAATLPPIEKPMVGFKEDIIKHSRETYANPRPVVEQAIKQWHEPIKLEPKVTEPKRFDKPGPALKDILNSALKKTPAPVVVPTPAPSIQTQATPMPRPQQIQQQKDSQENELRKVITLNYLKNVPAPNVQPKKQASAEPKKNPKEPTKENVNALRNALSAVLGANASAQKTEPKKIEQKPQAQPQATQQKQEQKAPETPKVEQKKESPQKSEESAEVKKVKEVPEEILKKILEIKS